MEKRALCFKRFVGIVICIGIGIAGAAFAQERGNNTSANYHGAKEEGWFWYKDPKEEKPVLPPKKEIKKEAPKEAKAEEKQELFSMQWLKENYPKLKDKAIEDPSDDNLRAFLYAQRLMFDKAQNFAVRANMVATMDPLLDENNRIPLAAAAKATLLRQTDDDRKEALKHLSKISGLWFFFDSNCHYCKAQNTYLKLFKEDYKFIVKNISVDGMPLETMEDWVKDQGQAKMLGLQMTPTTVLVVPPNGFYIVSQGLNSVDGLADKIIMAANANNLLPKNIKTPRDTFDRGVLKPEDMKIKDMSDDPKEWVRFLQEKIGSRMKTQ